MNLTVIWLTSSSWTGVLTAAPKWWHLADIHSKSMMRHTKNVVPLSWKEKMAAVCSSLSGLQFSSLAGPRRWALRASSCQQPVCRRDELSKRCILMPVPQAGWFLTITPKQGTCPLHQHNQICHSLPELAFFSGFVLCLGANNCHFLVLFLQ